MKINEVIKRLQEVKKQGITEVIIAVDEEYNAISYSIGMELDGKTATIYPENPQPLDDRDDNNEYPYGETN